MTEQLHLQSIEDTLSAMAKSTSMLRHSLSRLASSIAENTLLIQQLLDLLSPLPNQHSPDATDIVQQDDGPNQTDSQAADALAGDFGLLQGETIDFPSEQPNAKRYYLFSESVNVSIALVVQPKESSVDDIASQEHLPNALRSGSLLSDTANFGDNGHFHNQRAFISEHGFDPGGKQSGHLAAAQVFEKMSKSIDFVPPEISTLMDAEPVRADNDLIPKSNQSSVFRWYEASSICSFAAFEFTNSYTLCLPFSNFTVVDESLRSPYLPHTSEFLGISKELKRFFMSLDLRGRWGLFLTHAFTQSKLFDPGISSVLPGVGDLGMLDRGIQIHCYVMKNGFEQDKCVVSALIDMYGKCRSTMEMSKVFDEMDEKDIGSCNALVTGLVRNGCVDNALELFDKFKRQRMDLNVVSWTSMIAGYVQVGVPLDALKVFEQMEKVGLEPDQGMPSEVMRQRQSCFFQNLRKAGLKSTSSTLGSILSAIASLATLVLGLLVHEEAIKLGLLANVYVGSSLISMSAKCKKMEAARKVFDVVDRRKVVLWNSILGGYAQNGCAIEVITLFSSLGSCGLHADDFTYTSILSACACLAYLEVGHQLHPVIIKNNFASNLFVGNALVDMYAKSGVLDDARRQFARMRNCGNIAALMHGKAAHCFSLKRGISYAVHRMFLLLLFTIGVDHVEQQVTPLILVDSEASYMLQPMLILVKLKLPHATFVRKQWLIPWVWRYSLAFNLEDKVVFKGGVML